LLIVVPIAAVFGALWDGATGMVVFSTPAYCAIMAIMAKETLAELNSRFSDLWSATWPILSATAVMSAVVLVLQVFVAASFPGSPWVGLILLSVSGAIIYGAALLATGSPVIREGAEVAGWILFRHKADG
jgi:hypothetical protein